LTKESGPVTTGPLSAPVLRVAGASKHFGGVFALRDVSLEVAGGQIHAVLGQNGSGKSTLMKCLAGFHEPEPGWELSVNGIQLDRPLRTGEFRQLGMSFVHQDLGLIPSLDVTENLRMVQLAAGELRQIRWGRLRQAAGRLLAEFDVEIDPAETVAHLRPVERALLAIVRAVDELRRWKEKTGADGGVLFLDEATALLDREGKARVARLVRRVVADGAGVVMVSHDLKEVIGVAQQITILRDGVVATSVGHAEFTGPDGVESLIEQMTGHRRNVGAIARARRESPHGDGIAVRIEDLRGGLVRQFSADLRQGEVLGVTGLVGAGWEDVPLLVYGAKRAESGVVRIGTDETPIHSMTPRRAVEAGMGLVPANRQEDGIVGELSIGANVSLPVIGRFMSGGLLRVRREQAHVNPLLQRYGVVPPEPSLSIDALSGGNQQKAVMAKWLSMAPRLLLLQDPTQGVDVAARERIHDVVWRAARDGTAVLYASADYEELEAVADRVLVMSDGVLVDELDGDRVTEDAIAASALRGRTIAQASNGEVRTT
jgi:ribose transport system ATP-binding protein